MGDRGTVTRSRAGTAGDDRFVVTAAPAGNAILPTFGDAAAGDTFAAPPATARSTRSG